MLKLVIPATEEPVSLPEFVAHLHGTAEGDDDGDLTRKLSAAREYVEGITGRALVTSTWELRLACWPASNTIFLPLGNAQSIVSVKYTDSAGVEQTMDPADYKLVRAYTPASDGPPPVAGDGPNDCGIARLMLAYGKSWPSATLDTGESIAIRYACGWDGALNVPYSLRAAILLVAATLYKHRESVMVNSSSTAVAVALISDGQQSAVDALVSRYVDRRF